MPAYDILCIAKCVRSASSYVRIFREASKKVIKSGGLVRGIDNLGVRPLPYRMRAHTKYNYYGNFFKFKVQAAPAVLKDIDWSFKLDEDMIRWTPIKMPRRMRVQEDFTGVQPITTPDEERKFLRQHLPLDYSIAVELLKEGKVTKEELEALPKRKWKVPEYFAQKNKERD